MAYSPLDLMGLVVQWVSSLLLLLLFYRVGRFGARRRTLRIWMAAWAAQVAAITGFALQSLAVLIGHPLATAGAWIVIDDFYVPGKLVFDGLIALGAMQAIGREVNRKMIRWVVLSLLAVGIAAVLVDSRALTGGLEVGVTVVVFAGAAIAVFRTVRDEDPSRLAFLAAALALFGTVTTIYLIGDYFGPLPGDLGAFIGAVNNSSGYGDGLVSAVLGAAVIILIVDDAFRAADRARGERLRDLAASEARLTGVIEAAREAILTVGPDGRIDLANATAERRFGVRRGGALGRPLSDFITTSDPLHQLIEASSAGDRTSASLTGEGRRDDGTIFPVELTLGAIERDGRSGAVAIIRDLTARRAADAEREAFERRMAESEKMLAIGRVVSGVAHELNNPLAVVLGQSEQLVDSASAADTRDGLRLINEQAHRARRIVRDLLAFVHRRDEVHEPVDLSDLITRVVAAQHGRADEHGVSIVTAIDGEPSVVLAGRLAVEQALVNLIDNGLDAAGRGGRVRIAIGRRGEQAEIHVEDSGSGVPDELVPRIFEPFFTTKPTGQGTGLGLAVSLGAVERHGGSLRLENRPAPGIGARFIAAFPLDQQPHGAASEPRSGRHRITTLPRPIARSDGAVAETMLIDDEAAVRSTLSRIFQRGGWRVREAATGEEALHWLLQVPESAAPDLLLCDLKMPGLSGRDVYAHLQQQRPALLDRLIFVTGDVAEPGTAAFLKGTGRPVVEKPFTVSEIAEAVEAVLHPSPVSSEG
ncbi:MAG TPA: ATP-binding protein [Gemmatimonadales bacterium]|jgi:two-component system NtrC family sensor kinase